MSKWRPSLWFVVFGGLGGTLLVSFLGLVALRYLGPEIGFRQAAVLLALAITGCTALLGWLLVRLLLRPVDALAQQARAMRTGGVAQSPRHFGTRELRDLAMSVVEMGRALQGREAAIRTYTDHVTHELKTPVTAIRAAAELLEDGGHRDPLLLQQITGATTQMEAQLAALRQMSAAQEPGHAGSSCLAEVADDLAALHPGAVFDGVEVPLPLAASGLRVVLGHLLTNAAEAGAATVTVSADPQGITVSDTGPGVSAGNAARLFDSFFTTRREAGGTGMGLSIVRALLSTHGWTIQTVASDIGLTLRLDAP
ncbi:two-component sensor histidine kinase [Jannaschia pagri]|uniref:histidine kinase n=1 Tax=Jannaschia pagri TaxID=2829797 RepID=A0ABQ4NR39_9RHOB|nr:MULTISPECIES: HAMP domain-containing sensor histidine kinase [unclassified Jannaschia]GIT93043.1 two-component sensor histidine kinase [Jannaschia sp. AI_61]GIT96878.1 two-component sensor histidine kinase [Jannaschia sp. AI_62]